MFINIARAFLMALAAMIAIATAPALAQERSISVKLNCTWSSVVYDVVPDNSKPAGNILIEGAACDAKQAWRLPVSGGVKATFNTREDVVAFLKESARLHTNALGSQDFLVKDLRAELDKAKKAALESENGAIAARNSAVDAIKARAELESQLKTTQAALKTAQEKIKKLEADAKKTASDNTPSTPGS